MGKKRSFKKAQTTMDYLILTTVVLVVVTPLLYLSTERLGDQGEAQVTEAIHTLKNGIIQVNNLGAGTGIRVVLQIPKGMEHSSVSGDEISYVHNGQTYVAHMPAEIKGNMPMNEGRHHVNLYNDGFAIHIYECGNELIEAFEQCDGSALGVCQGGVQGLGCVGSEEQVGMCKCRCSASSQCQTGLCVPFNPTVGLEGGGYCAPCIRNEECGTGKICVTGTCQIPPCTTGSCTGGQICSTGTGTCQACQSNQECINEGTGSYCCGGACQGTPCPAQTCTPGIGECGIQVCLNEICQPCTTNTQCENEGSGLPYCCAGECQTSPTCSAPICGNGAIEQGEQCEFTYRTLTPPPLSTASPICGFSKVCNPTNCLCVPQTTVSICGDGVVNVGTTEQCDKGAQNGQAGNALVQCAALGGNTCGLDCQCTGAGQGYCGNGEIEPGEECDPAGGPACSGGGFCLGCQCVGAQCGNGQVEPGEECDPTATPTGCIPIAGTTMIVSCQNDCSCGYSDTLPPVTPITCDNSATPACGGPCPGEEICTDVQGACTCLPLACESSSTPACGGTCPPGENCRYDGQTCLCVAQTSSCSSSIAPACGGTCEGAGETCVDTGGSCECKELCESIVIPGGEGGQYCGQEGWCPEGGTCDPISTTSCQCESGV